MPTSSSPAQPVIEFHVPADLRGRVPEAAFALAGHVASKAAALIAKGLSLQAFAFLARDAALLCQPIPIDTCSAETKQEALGRIRARARDLGAEYAVTVVETWAYAPKSRHEAQAICQSGGGISDKESKTEGVLVLLETAYGTWAALGAIERDESGARVPHFAFWDSSGSEGRIFRILPRDTGPA